MSKLQLSETEAKKPKKKKKKPVVELPAGGIEVSQPEIEPVEPVSFQVLTSISCFGVTSLLHVPFRLRQN